MTGINSALGPITAACPGDRQTERDQGLPLLSYRPVSHTRQRYREKQGRKKLSDRKTGGERESEGYIDPAGLE